MTFAWNIDPQKKRETGIVLKTKKFQVFLNHSFKDKIYS